MAHGLVLFCVFPIEMYYNDQISSILRYRTSPNKLITNLFDQIVQTATYMETKKCMPSTRGEVNVIKI